MVAKLVKVPSVFIELNQSALGTSQSLETKSVAKSEENKLSLLNSFSLLTVFFRY
jgi:hypothetical protein